MSTAVALPPSPSARPVAAARPGRALRPRLLPVPAGQRRPLRPTGRDRPGPGGLEHLRVPDPGLPGGRVPRRAGSVHGQIAGGAPDHRLRARPVSGGDPVGTRPARLRPARRFRRLLRQDRRLLRPLRRSGQHPQPSAHIPLLRARLRHDDRIPRGPSVSRLHHAAQPRANHRRQPRRRHRPGRAFRATGRLRHLPRPQRGRRADRRLVPARPLLAVRPPIRSGAFPLGRPAGAVPLRDEPDPVARRPAGPSGRTGRVPHRPLRLAHRPAGRGGRGAGAPVPSRRPANEPLHGAWDRAGPHPDLERRPDAHARGADLRRRQGRVQPAESALSLTIPISNVSRS